jgi:hypothetical protein
MIAAFGRHFIDTIFLSEVLLADKFNLDSIVGSQSLGVFPQLIMEGFGQPGIIDDPRFGLATSFRQSPEIYKLQRIGFR